MRIAAVKSGCGRFLHDKGAVGTKVLLQGAHFMGTMAVTFSGVSATFRLLTANYISVTVPSGAKTGKIAVANAGGTTTSTKPFESSSINVRGTWLGMWGRSAFPINTFLASMSTRFRYRLRTRRLQCTS
jgi:hypothetical protein